MGNNDLTFSASDLGDIFGAEFQAKEKEAEKPKIAHEAPVAPDPKDAAGYKSSLITQSKAEEYKIVEKIKAGATKPAATTAAAVAESDVDGLIQRAKQIEEEMKTKEAPAKAATTEPVQGLLNEKALSDILSINEEIRKVIFSELALCVNARSINSMLLKTLEKAAVNFLVLRNTNWDSAGKIREEGTVDAERFIGNIKKYKEQAPEMEKEIENAMCSLLHLRLRAVKLGVSAAKYAEVKEKISSRLHTIKAGHNREIIDFITGRVLEPAYKKGDEEK